MIGGRLRWWVAMVPPTYLRYATHVGRTVRPVKETITMATTFELYPAGWYQNYCTRPTQDVEVQPDVHVCATCDTDLDYVPHPKGLLGAWQHTDPTVPCDKPKTLKRCRYCNAHDGYTYDNEQTETKIIYTQEAYYDRTECTRCGGVNGYGIGD